jgi:acetyl-CoA carboxylase carboxyl transferase beta subunit
MNPVREKLKSVLDYGVFKELWADLYTYDYLKFANYHDKLESARLKSGERDAVIAGIGSIAGCKCVIAAFEPLFMMGSMGLVAGEKISRSFRLAAKRKLPVITFSASGGARMQEGMVSLIQMAKTAAAVYDHMNKGMLFISVICDPTLGGVTASFASLADIIIGERGARFGFTGKRIIEETTHEILQEDFQTIEYACRHGMVDIVIDKTETRAILAQILKLHNGGAHDRKH